MRLLVAGLSEEAVTPWVCRVSDLVHDVRVVTALDGLEGAVHRYRPDVVIVEAARVGPERIARLGARHPRASFLATGGASVGQWAEVARCVDIVERGSASDLRRALVDLAGRGGVGVGEVTVLLGGKGGVGTTALAIQLAAALAQRGTPTAVLDLQIYLGDVAWTAGVLPDPSLQWALGRRRDAPLLTLARHPVGFAVLGPDPDLRTARSIGADQVGTLVADLCAAWQQVVVDVGAALTEGALAAADAATRILVVTTEERAALEGARRRIAGLRPLLRQADAVTVVLNRATGAVQPAEVEAFVGAPLAAVVRNAWTDMSGAIEAHEALCVRAPDAGVTQDLDRLADLVAGPAPTPAPAPRRSWFEGLVGR